jgi:hypothetical protein
VLFRSVRLGDAANSRALFYKAVVLDRLRRTAEATDILNSLASGDFGKYTERAQQYLQERDQPKN